MGALKQVAGGGEIGALLAAMTAYGSEFERTFSNHAPMALTALAGIGGTPARLESFFAYYRDCKKLPPFAAPREPLDASNWEAAIGQREREPDLRGFFRAEVARLGVPAALRLYLPRLAPGVAASAFHGLMRLAYALLRESEDDIAVALAYWAATYLPLRPARGASPITDDPAEVLARVSGFDSLRKLHLHDLLWQNMRDAAAAPEFATVVDWLAIDERTLGRMAATGLTLFASTQHFAALHVVTGAHWLRIVEPFAERAAFYALLRHFWQGVCGLVGEMGFPRLPDAATLASWRRIEAPGWPLLHAAARESFDEHDISLAFSAFEEDKAYADPLYRVALARRLGLIREYRR